jgi:phage-related baseplate assembly protein
MVNEQVQTLHEPCGSPVTNVMFDLSHEQLGAAAHAVGEIIVERHRGHELETDDVLALRELTALRDELGRLTEAQGNATVLMTLGRLILFHDAADEWVHTRVDRGWMREADDEAHPLVAAMLDPLASLRGRAVEAALRATADSTS